jgi:Trehalase-like, N-terminal
MSKYPLIAVHGLIGNLQTAALVSIDGTIDWFWAPRFDSPSIFGCLLDHDHGGHLRIRPTVDVFNRHQLWTLPRVRLRHVEPATRSQPLIGPCSGDGLLSRWRRRPPYSSREGSVTDVLGSGVGDDVVTAIW